MSFGNAVRFVRNKHKPGEITINLSSIGREIVLRGHTTDIACFDKIFLRDEYGTPFEKGTPPKVIIDGGANIGMATVYYGVDIQVLKFLLWSQKETILKC